VKRAGDMTQVEDFLLNKALSSKPCTTEKNLKILNIQINMKEDP
jgi:hypothetical protein